MKNFIKITSVIVLAFAITGCSANRNISTKDNLKDKKELNILFVGSSWMASGIGQHHLVPNLLEQQGYKINVGKYFGPGASFENHIENNNGDFYCYPLKEKDSVWCSWTKVNIR